MHQQQAYSIFSVKAFDDDSRTFSGVATTPTPDRGGDVVEPMGVSYTNPMPLLWFHDQKSPVGTAIFKTPTPKGIEFEATIPRIEEECHLKGLVDDAWNAVKARIVRGVSIRVVAKAQNVKKLAGGGLHWLKSEVIELSLVTIPQQVEATIHNIKSFDAGLAATGTEGPRLSPTTTTLPGVTGLRVVRATTTGTAMPKPITDQIKSFEATRAAKAAERDGIMEAAAESGETLDSEKASKYDELNDEIKSVDAHLKRLNDLHESNVAAAKSVTGTTQDEGTKSRALHAVSVKDNRPEGTNFARLAMVVAASKGNRSDALLMAEEAYPNDKRFVEVVKAAVGAATTGNAQGPLLQYTDYFQDFVDYLRPATIIGKFGQNGVPALRKVPFNVRIATQTAGGSGYWVGQGLPVPLTKGTFGTTTMDFTKVGAISVLTKEEVRFTTPGAEMKVRDDLRDSLVARIDQDLVDPSNAGTANVKPASITYGVAATAVSGTSATNLRTDFKNLSSGFIAANIAPTSGVLIMSSTMALAISLQMNALGQPEFPNLAMTGGTLFGIPVIVSEYLTALGSPSTQMIVMVNASDIYLADDGAVTIESSDQTSLEMSDAPAQSGVTGTGASMVSMFQTEMVALKAGRFINWKLRRAAAVAYLSGAAYA